MRPIMRWTPGGRSQDIEDRRGQGSGGRGRGGLKLGLGGLIIVGVLSLVLKRNLFSELSGGAPAVAPDQVPAGATSPEEEKLVV